ncbi:hypothetical protein H6G51_14745 [Limnothrix sp. FACHB-708]|uniref:hypothetical protein n=1 Tax=unclassified Limnothrix TaxID=2632864 RepID=UPI001689246D|nr:MULTISPECIES: hypothetical protein [unclassified Limnothrix]MBD2554543.1 hypothetical protein [Limnothrix sp. FACHB-708]MBD2591569.1 hypothetical protein [Limnothrix sp. FACHB-406]
MNYLIAVFADRMGVEAAYTALEAAGFDLKQMAILGKGYKTADEFGFIDPSQQARRQIKMMAFWTIPFGFLAGVGFSLATGLQTFTEWAGPVGNHLVGGLLGAIGGAMGSVTVGGGLGLTGGNGDVLAYRNRLDQDQYLLVIKNLDLMQTRQANDLIRLQNPETVQGYTDSGAV